MSESREWRHRERPLPGWADGCWPSSLLVVGCGLIGTSLAMAWRERWPQTRLVGVEVNPHYRAVSERLVLPRPADGPRTLDGFNGEGPKEAARVFDEVLPELPDDSFQLAALAVPVDVACRLLPEVAQRAEVVFDVCSVKASIAKRAEDLGLRSQFAPTHPMAGAAVAGPEGARPDLFRGEAWLLIDGWPACVHMRGLLADLEARPLTVASAEQHDLAMAAVSHGVHLASLATMSAYDRALRDGGSEAWAGLTGPGFRDVTRLAASPPEFWVPTLLANRTAVSDQLRRVQAALEAFATALDEEDADRLEQLLREAREAHSAWRKARESSH
jgi:prephenate dehydrogenase